MRYAFTTDIGIDTDIASKTLQRLECGPMPNVMAAQPNIGDALCETSVR